MTRLEEYRKAYSAFEAFLQKNGAFTRGSVIDNTLQAFQFAEFLLTGMEQIQKAKTMEEIRGIVASRLED